MRGGSVPAGRRRHILGAVIGVIALCTSVNQYPASQGRKDRTRTRPPSVAKHLQSLGADRRVLTATILHKHLHAGRGLLSRRQ